MPLTPFLRPARPTDAPVIGESLRAIARVPGRLASRPEEIDDARIERTVRALDTSDRGRFVVAESEGAIVGHAFLEPLDIASTSHVVQLTIAVHEAFQRRGVGRALMRDLLDWAKAHAKIEKVELHVRSGNAPAIALYESLGFQVEGRLSRRVKLAEGDYLDDIFMALWVGP